MSNKAIEVKGFKHHRQPYGTHMIDGVWTPYCEQDIINSNKWHDENISYDLGRGKAEAETRIRNMIKRDVGQLVGTIVEGSTTNRIFHHTSTRSDAGKSTQLDLTRTELERGEKVSVAM